MKHAVCLSSAFNAKIIRLKIFCPTDNMDSYKGRVALVTGASSGIGAAICKTLVKYGMNVVGAARRQDKIEVRADSKLVQYIFVNL